MRYELAQIAEICGGHFYGGDGISRMTVENVFTDSRSFPAEQASLFVAIEGRNHDGHSFVNQLYNRGIRAFIIEKDIRTDKYTDAGFILVESSVDALQRLAGYYRRQFDGTVVAITGSNGKTVVKEWLSDLIPQDVKLFRSPKSYNSQIGVPLSVLMMEGDEEIAVFEAGISEPGEMERLERVLKPDLGVITTIGDAHQESFDSVRRKTDEKLLLFRQSPVIVYNSDYPEVKRALEESYPERVLIDASPQSGFENTFSDNASRQNAALAVAICETLGFDSAETLSKVRDLNPVAMRLELKEGINDSVIINDSYNSDINSLAIALDYLRSVAGSRRQTLILSDILQSGYPEEELYQKVALLVNRSPVDRLIGIGTTISNFGPLFAAHSDFYTSTEAYLRTMRREDIAGRAVLLKGNRRSQFERLSHALDSKSHTTTLTVDLDAILHNLNVHRELLRPSTKLMAMLKAYGYGHGTYEIASLLQHQGVDYLAVAFADEGVALRESGITIPIVVLNADSDSFELMVGARLEPEIYNLQSLRDFVAVLKRYGERSYPIHIKLDTGMHRLGFDRKDIPTLRSELAQIGRTVRVGSVFSHFACSDDPSKDDYTHMQLEVFRKISDELTEGLSYEPPRHISNSAAIGRFPEAELDMVRLGIGLYGVTTDKSLGLHEVTTLKTRVVQVKKIEGGETIGYGCACGLDADTVVATIPVGYADGLDRRLGEGNWSVVVGGKSAPIIGRICMDTCMIDVTGTNVSVGDEVTVFGGGTGNSITDMADVLNTIPYEIMTSISQRVKRIFIKE